MLNAFVSFAALAIGSAQPAEEAGTDVEALLDRMTLEEKVGQLVQFNGFWDPTGPAPTGDMEERKFAAVEKGIVGSMLNVVGAEDVRTIQTYAMENSRLKIPMVFAYDVIHGHKTMFPIPLAEAASWNMDLIGQSAAVAAEEAAAQGLNWTFAPMVDISRDPRWGRVMEGAGEDPYLGSRIAVARVRGFQGEDLSAVDTIAACLKHFAAYGFAEAGKDYNAAELGTVTLFNTVLPPFKAGIEEAGALTVMNAFNTLNGIPATADDFLQRDILKDRWGFEGFVVSDWGSGREMIDHGFAADLEDAARLSILGGSDMDMESYAYFEHLEGLVETGIVDEGLVDDAVRRVLQAKVDLGLFDDPFRYIDEAREAEVLSDPEHRDVSRRVAEESAVLLKNEGGLLPLKEGERIALIGPLADDKDSPLGNWRAKAEKDSAVSVVEGFEAAGIAFDHEPGVVLETSDTNFATEIEVNMTDRSGMEEAVRAAAAADKVVLVLGEDAYHSGEARSRAELGFPGLQQELLEKVVEANPNTVLVVMSGRPLVLTWADENVPAILQAWHLGQESGTALANLLTGKVSPSGKLPMTFPRSVGQIPIYYNALNTGRPGPRTEVFWSHYMDESNAPLYPFGHGLSYSSFEYDRLRVREKGNGFEVSVRLRNTGNHEAKEVAQLYIRDRVASVSRPVKELKGFEKVSLRPGQSRTIRFELTEKELGFYDPRGEFLVEPGAFDVMVGGSSDTALSASFTLSER
ncbi:beta-glucosidase BglX [Parvularcula maris]|uniref:Beta-D-glucoside glucohydrolase n=1 Tax=Parvularcula maris TaxID=2965077 RepID=A0A9X2RI99_9PROT|nr:beta-glucosidase BglX [Parvularcula maris]MCQ8184726.1 beta-glucosidase BglX [Parvularcula maris]